MTLWYWFKTYPLTSLPPSPLLAANSFPTKKWSRRYGQEFFTADVVDFQVDAVLGAAVYVVKVKVGTLEKIVRRRYSEFDALRTLTHALVKIMAEKTRADEAAATAKAFEAATAGAGSGALRIEG